MLMLTCNACVSSSEGVRLRDRMRGSLMQGQKHRTVLDTTRTEAEWRRTRPACRIDCFAFGNKRENLIVRGESCICAQS